MAIAAKVPAPRFRRISSKNNEQEIVVSGEDLIIPVPYTQAELDTNNLIFINFPANPLYWTGTRLAGLARVYQQYRPLKLDVEYIPQVPVTVPGQVIMGTLWNVESKGSSLQQNLMTSDGSRMIQCYERARSYVNLKSSKLPQRYFNVFGDMSSQGTNPFSWVAHYTGTNASGVKQPGYIYVRWTYKFCVAIGDRDIPVQSISQSDDTVTSLFKNYTDVQSGWGITLSALRNLKRILRNTAIFFLRSVAVTMLDSLPENNNLASKSGNDSTTIGPGRCYSLDVVSLKDDKITITDDTGSHYVVNDENVRVCMYAHGEEVEVYESDFINIGLEPFDSTSTGYSVDITFNHVRTYINSGVDRIEVDVFCLGEDGSEFESVQLASTGPSEIAGLKVLTAYEGNSNYSNFQTVLWPSVAAQKYDYLRTSSNMKVYWNREQWLEKFPALSTPNNGEPTPVKKKTKIVVVTDSDGE